MGFSKDFLNGLPRKNGDVAQWMGALRAADNGDGSIALFAPYEYTTTGVLTCKMEWDDASFAQTVAEFEDLGTALRAIAPYLDELAKKDADPAAILQDEALVQVYRTYLAPLDNGPYDYGKVYDVQERLDCIGLLKDLEAEAACGDLTDESVLESARADFGDITVTDEEIAYMNAYYAHTEQQAVLRVGAGYGAHAVCVGAVRLARLINVGAPDIVIRNEWCDYATAFLLHRHALSVQHTPLSYEESRLIEDEE